MLENSTPSDATPSRSSGTAVKQPIKCRSATTNKPMRRANGNTAIGRRVRDLYRAYLAGMSNPDDATRAAVLAAAELVVAAESARAKLLAGEGDIEQIVRLENLANRAVKRLGIRPDKREQRSALADYLSNMADTADDEALG